ncbi:iron-containing redox enzyme family protein [Sorangium sp. So ce1078]|uniref:iron-containing redox enzyme family protein n=1 Tax=Sorangium sp. So ce1078 TaxID=3133329 RepID=UPI003F5EFC7E
MTVTTDFFHQPRLREAVTLQASDESCLLRYRDEEYEIDLAPETRDDSVRLLEMLLRGGKSMDELSNELPSLSHEVARVCRDLDRFGLLTETFYKPLEAKGGAQFYRELQRFIERVRRKYSTRSFYQGLVDGTLGREQLIGYALEYYHIVRMCPGLLAPALSYHESRTTLRILQDFFVSELNHDRLIERSLAAVGIERKDLDRLVPLPMTFTICSSLGVYARQHPLSFKAALFLFEEVSDEFHAAYKKRCIEVGLPEAFYKPILDHASINDDGDHEQISEALFAEIPCISDEEQKAVMRHLGILVESIVLMDGQIVDYYGKPGSVTPRVWD